MPAAYPSGQNTFVKDHAASGALVVDFSRNVETFKLNRYIQLRPVSKSAGYYLRMTVAEAGRVMNSNLADFVWPDGADRPMRNEGTESFQFLAFNTNRYDYGYNLGDKAVDQAEWDIVGTHSRIKAQQAMTARTQLAITQLTTSGNYDSGHTSAVASISGVDGNWAQSTTDRLDIKRSLNYAANVIRKDTLGVVLPKDLVLLIGPDTALEMSESQEITDHIKGSPDALAQIRGDLPGDNAAYGLPDFLYGYKVEVEDAVKETAHKGATASKSFIMGSGDAVMLARPGGLVNAAGGPTFSTITCFAYEEMTVEELRDERNRRTEGHVVDDIDMVMTAPVSGFYFTSAV